MGSTLEEYNIGVAFQAQVNGVGHGPVQISYAMLKDNTSQSSDNSAPKRVRLHLKAGDKFGVQVAGFAGGRNQDDSTFTYPNDEDLGYVIAPAGRSILTLKRLA